MEKLKKIAEQQHENNFEWRIRITFDGKRLHTDVDIAGIEFVPDPVDLFRAIEVAKKEINEKYGKN